MEDNLYFFLFLWITDENNYLRRTEFSNGNRKKRIGLNGILLFGDVKDTLKTTDFVSCLQDSIQHCSYFCAFINSVLDLIFYLFYFLFSLF